MPQIAALQSQSALRDRSGSWMLPEAKSEDLLYISDVTGVHVFSYPKGTLVGDLTGFASPQGLWTADRRRGRGAVD